MVRGARKEDLKEILTYVATKYKNSRVTAVGL